MFPSGNRKEYPVFRGFVKIFPRGMAAVAKHSAREAGRHTGGEIAWNRDASSDDTDALMRHLLEGDWVSVAWRAMASLEKHLENEEVWK